MPDFVGLVNDSALARVVVKFEHLQDFDLQVEVEMLVISLDRVQVLELGDVLAGKHRVIDEDLGDPLSCLPQNMHFSINTDSVNFLIKCRSNSFYCYICYGMFCVII